MADRHRREDFQHALIQGNVLSASGLILGVDVSASVFTSSINIRAYTCPLFRAPLVYGVDVYLTWYHRLSRNLYGASTVARVPMWKTH